MAEYKPLLRVRNQVWAATWSKQNTLYLRENFCVSPISFLPQCTCFHFKMGLKIFVLEITEKSY